MTFFKGIFSTKKKSNRKEHPQKLGRKSSVRKEEWSFLEIPDIGFGKDR